MGKMFYWIFNFTGLNLLDFGLKYYVVKLFSFKLCKKYLVFIELKLPVTCMVLNCEVTAALYLRNATVSHTYL